MISLNKEIIFVLSTKCACSAMHRILSEYFEIQDTGDYTSAHRKIGQMPQRFFDGTRAWKELIAEGLEASFTFALVRNPWDHILSCDSYLTKQIEIDFSFEDLVTREAGCVAHSEGLGFPRVIRPHSSIKTTETSRLFDRGGRES